MVWYFRKPKVHYVSKTGFVFALRWGVGDTYYVGSVRVIILEEAEVTSLKAMP
jgi:hypothetical protein